MKEERIKILDMIEKGIINPQEAERLLLALNESVNRINFDNVCAKAGNIMEQIANGSKKAVDKAKPHIEKAAEKVAQKATEIKESINREIDKKANDVPEAMEEDFEKDIYDDISLEEIFDEDEKNKD